MFKIEKNIPVPKSGRGRRSIYPFRQMEVGDSFLVPASADERLTLRMRVNSAAYVALGKGNYSTALEDEGVRIWRRA